MNVVAERLASFVETSSLSGNFRVDYHKVKRFFLEESMTPSLKSLGIDRLSVAERIFLVGEIWGSLVVNEAEFPLTKTQRQDLQLRIATYEANPKTGSSRNEVKARLKGSRELAADHHAA